MFDQETELIIKAVQQRTIANQPAIAVKDLLAADIPYAIKTFLRADVELMLLDELQRHQKSSHFNFNHPEVRSLQSQINSVLVLHFSFERSEFLRRMNDTVHLIINYLIRPQWTLTNVLFEKEETIATTALVRMLKYFGPYEYLKDILVRYTQEKQLTSFSKKDFSTFLWKADGEYIRRKTGDELARIMSPIYEFMDFPKNSGTRLLPVRGLLKFFEDKGMSSVLHRLEGELVQGRTDFSRRELGEVLEDVRRTSGAFEVEAMEHRSNQFEHEGPVASAMSASGHTQPVTQPAVDGTIIIDEGDRKKFLKKIFLQEEHALASALQALNALPTWKQASVYIDEIFIRNDVDPYSPEAKRFIDVVYQQYHSKK